MLKKFSKWILLFLSLTLIINTLSHSFDGDLGWHLRFGKQVLTEKTFPYQDTYTWSFGGNDWTNHEWGGDIIFWLLYTNFSYSALILLAGISIWLALIFSVKIFSKKIEISDTLIIVLLSLVLNFILTVRLAMLSPLFFILIIVTLERTEKKSYYYWPILFWIWGAVHGSWILGFIAIGIYLFAYLITNVIPNRYSLLIGKKMIWDNVTAVKISIATILSALAITINPYGLKIWIEIIHYFTEGYFKQFITEWLPSYTYPIFIWPLILGATALVFIVWGHVKKKLTLAQTLLFLAIFYATLRHKRNNLYLIILLVPIFSNILNLAIEQIKKPVNKILSKTLLIITIFTSICLIIFQIKDIDWTANPFQNSNVLARYGFPQTAIEFLKTDNKQENSKIFNEFWWGGYLNWTMPEILVFLDGRGTATWKINTQETLFGAYRRIKFESGGLEELERNGVRYVILDHNFSGYALPNTFDNWMFGENLDKIFALPQPHLVSRLERSENWQLIYQDRVALIWKNIAMR
ncbi:MAG TPA: hypothetical protein DCS29_04540 [Candidatus Magasanikbacteria bacterium]|nr:MAG: hypothetical protein A2479_01205 [Candidatus Magasanikbacteria bacterium RIFOXYC2_FULL_39_8]HAT04009.1 hypothetical protein [Candidatus Magasanikbacteria bacterium]